MAKNVRKIEPTAPIMSVLDLRPLLKKKRVAAYARVSTEKDEQQNSYDAQIDYYTTLIRKPQFRQTKLFNREAGNLVPKEGQKAVLLDGSNQIIAAPQQYLLFVLFHSVYSTPSSLHQRIASSRYVSAR